MTTFVHDLREIDDDPTFTCMKCQHVFSPAELWGVSIANGGLLCETCAQPIIEADLLAAAVSPADEAQDGDD